MMKQLIDELRKELDGEPSNDAEAGYDSGILCAIAIIEKHLADKAIVPLEPIMYQVFAGEAEFKTGRYSRDEMVNAYKAMIAANKGE